MSFDQSTDQVESAKDFEQPPAGVAQRWISEVFRAEKTQEKFHKRGKRVIRRYRDEDRKEDSNLARLSLGARMNILWSNVETLKTAVYARAASPEVSRRIKDKDPIARMSSEVIERGLQFLSEDGRDHDIFKRVRDDRLLPGRGQVWVRFIPEIVPDMNFETGEIEERIVSADISVDYVHWQDYLEDPGARFEDEISWKARKVYLTRDELVQRFGQEIGGKVPLDVTNKSNAEDEHNDKEDGGKGASQFQKAVVYEIWHKPSRKVFWISKHYGASELDSQEDPLGLKDFFPCPRALCGTVTNDSVIPIPDYYFYEDLACELDEVCEKISLLVDAIKVAGVYDASIDHIEQLLTKSGQNFLIPVECWSKFAGQGGLKGSIDFLPLGEIITTLVELYRVRDQIIAKIYEITGISDIIRGSTAPQETATAQQIKSNYANLRLTDRQEEMQRFIREVFAIKAEIMAEHFPEETLARMAGVPEMGEQAMAAFPQVVELLRNDVSRSYKIEIETDSTISIDENQDKTSRIEFLDAVGKFMGIATQVGAQVPEMIPALGEMVMFGLRGFKAGRSLEEVFERSIAQAAQNQTQRLQQQQQQANKPQPQGGANPRIEAAKLQQKAQADQQKLMLDREKESAKIQLEREKIFADQDMERSKAETTVALELQKLQADIAMKIRELEEKSRLAAFTAQQQAQSKMLSNPT